MTDLTEQWKKGELPSGEYYIIDDLGLHTTDRYYPSHGFGAELPQAVLAPVPSYEEYLSLTYAKEEDEGIIAEYEAENAQLKEQINHLLKTQARQFVDNQKLQVKAEKAKDVVNIDTARQIKQLKELLKECLEVLEMVQGETIYFPRTVDDCIDKINQVLGEEK